MDPTPCTSPENIGKHSDASGGKDRVESEDYSEYNERRDEYIVKSNDGSERDVGGDDVTLPSVLHSTSANTPITAVRVRRVHERCVLPQLRHALESPASQHAHAPHTSSPVAATPDTSCQSTGIFCKRARSFTPRC